MRFKVLGVLVLLAAFSGCTLKQQLLSLDATSRLATLGRQLMTEACDGVKADCIKATDATCEKLKRCDAAEKQVYASVATVQVMAETTAAVLKAGGSAKEKGEVLLLEVIRRLDLIRDILKTWGVAL